MEQVLGLGAYILLVKYLVENGFGENEFLKIRELKVISKRLYILSF